MATEDPSNHPITLRRGETRPIPLVYRPRDLTLVPYNLTGKTVAMRIKPHGETEIVYGSPEISITDAVGGEITINISGATVTAYDFLNAPYVILLDGKRLIFGTLTIKSLYD